MNLLRAFLFCFLPFAAVAQAPPAPSPEPSLDTVLATYEGKTITWGDLKNYMATEPGAATSMRDRKAVVERFALISKLAELAEKAKLYEESPTKEMLQAWRTKLMAAAEVNAAFNGLPVPAGDVRAFYEASRERYSQARVKVIYISFDPNPKAGAAKKYLTEAEARAKAEKILAEIRKGADFVKMVKENSEDATSAAKDGDFGVIRRMDNLPEAIRAAIFALKPGQVTEPVRQPNGFYLFRAEEITVRPFDQVEDELTNELRQERFKRWMEQTQKGLNLKLENKEFFAGSGPVGVPAQPAPAAAPGK